MADLAVSTSTIDGFFRRWEASGAAERANYSMFLNELCDLLDVPRPDPAGPDDEKNAYVFERAVPFPNPDGSTTVKRIDLYKRDCFVLEAKQGSDRVETTEPFSLAPHRRMRRGTAVRGTAGWDAAMYEAKGQAELYVRNLPASEHNPPFIIVADVGHSMELFSDFSRQGRTYIPFPDPRTHRLKLRDLAEAEIRERLKQVWTEPLALDPSRRTAKVTREVAAKLAELARSLEHSGYTPDLVAHFLMRCLFTFFAEDVGLLPKECFTAMLSRLREDGRITAFPDMASSLWTTMKTGGFSPILMQSVLRFNGGLFDQATALPLTDEQIGLLIDSGRKQWREVEPAIFGTLLERALDKNERHKLGAHFTPRAYVERLVLPTIVEPLREQWSNVQAAAVTLAKVGQLPEARKEVSDFLDELCNTTILDPACGTANFLYVAMEHMKRLEGEVRDMLHSLGETQTVFEGTGHSVDPHQFLGIEINPRAAAIAELVLWIGYLQWHFRTFGARMPAEPIIKPFHNIECRDAVLEYDRKEPGLDAECKPVTRWAGQTLKKHLVTGEDVPDDSARTLVYRYVNPRKAEWPRADFVVGNPPFIGKLRMLDALGDGYVTALRVSHQDIPDSADLVMYWWARAAELASVKRIRRFGLITTNSITQHFNRKIIANALLGNQPIRIAYAVPDHPWVDSATKRRGSNRDDGRRRGSRGRHPRDCHKRESR
ncbi:MAG: DNA methyltransferase [Isosphaeraceae bacterium]